MPAAPSRPLGISHFSRAGLENDIFLVARREHISRAVRRIRLCVLLLALCYFPGFHLRILGRAIPLLLVCNLLQPIELFSVELIELGIDI